MAMRIEGVEGFRMMEHAGDGQSLSWGSRVQGGMLAALFGVIAASNLLGLANGWSPLAAMAWGVPLSLLGGWWYFRDAKNDPYFAAVQPTGFSAASSAAKWFGVLGLVYVALYLFLPLTVWPNWSRMSDIHGDILLYHLPKAVQLTKTGSLWDTAVHYSEYPSGYEILLALVIPAGTAPGWFGVVHAVVILFFFVTLLQLLRKYTELSAPLSWGLAATICAAPAVYTYLGYVGKNDMLLHAACLSMILHSPLGRFAERRDDVASPGGDGGQAHATRNPLWGPQHLPGMAMSAMIALATKPNGLGVVVPCTALVVLVAVVAWWQGSQTASWRSQALQWMVCALAVAPGMLWMVRNLIQYGSLSTGAVQDLYVWTIWRQRDNPQLWSWQWDTRMLALYAVLAVAAMGYALWSRPRWLLPCAMSLGLLAVFMITPGSAWGLNDLQERGSRIMFRYLTAFQAHALIVAMAMGVAVCGPAVARWYRTRPRLDRGRTALIVVAWVAVALSRSRGMHYCPEKNLAFVDCFSQPVGEGPYRSAYDYVNRNIHDSAIHFVGHLSIYCFGPGYTNTLVSSADDAQYVVAVPVPWTEQAEFPDFLASEAWQRDWQRCYADARGVVYRRATQADVQHAASPSDAVQR